MCNLSHFNLQLAAIKWLSHRKRHDYKVHWLALKHKRYEGVFSGSKFKQEG